MGSRLVTWTLGVGLLSVVLLFSQGCSPLRINQQGFERSRPRTVAVAVGYDISTEESLIPPYVELALTPYGLAPPATSSNLGLPLEGELNRIVTDRIQHLLAAKGYEAHLVESKPTSWVLFRNITNSPSVYADIVKRYNLETKGREFDALLVRGGPSCLDSLFHFLSGASR
jgi:hypothetical protein